MFNIENYDITTENHKGSKLIDLSCCKNGLKLICFHHFFHSFSMQERLPKKRAQHVTTRASILGWSVTAPAIIFKPFMIFTFKGPVPASLEWPKNVT